MNSVTEDMCVCAHTAYQKAHGTVCDLGRNDRKIVGRQRGQCNDRGVDYRGRLQPAHMQVCLKANFRMAYVGKLLFDRIILCRIKLDGIMLHTN